MQGWLLTSWQGTEAIPQKIEFCHRRQPHLSTESHSRGHGCSASPGEGWDLSTYRPASCIGKTGGESAQTRIHSLVRSFVRHSPELRMTWAHWVWCLEQSMWYSGQNGHEDGRSHESPRTISDAVS